MNPYVVVEEFEKRIADWCGSKYAVAVESGTAAIFLSLQYAKNDGVLEEFNTISIPRYTYPSTPCSIIHCGAKVEFTDDQWGGEYQLKPLEIWDSALRFKKGMYNGGLQCLSFHIKKLLPIGRGGMILLDDKRAYEWLKRARFDGRNPVPLAEDNFTMLGWNAYMQPADAARGIQLFEVLRQKYPDGVEDLVMEEQGYPDLSKFPIYKQ
jgi:dTDP-4-amino-4,6-dideoxygalactose transaminase